MPTTYTIDAQSKKIGRIASEAAKALMGKNLTGYVPNKVADVKVSIINASKADISAKKMEGKTYVHYTGFPGGLITRDLKQVVSKKGYGEIFKIAVKGMLPKNKLQSKMMKNLTVSE